MELESKDWKSINSALLRLYRELDAKRHARVMLEIINELVPSGSVVMNYFTPPDKLLILSIPEGFATDDQIALVGKYSHQSPFVYFFNAEDAAWKMTTDFMPIEDFEKLDLHQVALKPFGVHCQMAAMLASVDHTAHIITLQRGTEGFEERERAILNALHPHFVTSHINALAFSHSRDSASRLKAVLETAPGAYGCFTSDEKVAWVQPKAQAWLLEFFPDEVKAEGNVPHSILSLLRKSASKGGTPEHLQRSSRTARLTAMVSVSPLGGWILRLERGLNESASKIRPLPQFSPRKNQVLKWMAEGKRNSEIAVILGLSSRTVEKHVEDILRELGVENRATAILRAMELSAETSRQERY